jgi:hypothetical protein
LPRCPRKTKIRKTKIRPEIRPEIRKDDKKTNSGYLKGPNVKHLIQKTLMIAMCAFIMTNAHDANAYNASAGQQETITFEMVEAKNNAMEAALQNRAAHAEMIRFLHNHISADASFEITVSSPLDMSGGAPKMTLDKTEYINSHVQSGQFVTDYDVTIKTMDVWMNEADNSAVSTDLMIESGAMMTNEGKKQKPFVSRTKCTTIHDLENDILVSRESECKTDISYIEDI